MLRVVRVRKDVRTWIRFPASVAEHDSEGPWELIARQDGGGPVGRATVRRKQGIELMPVHLRFKSEGFIAFRFEAGEDRDVAGLALSVRPTSGTEGEPITLTWLGTHSGTENVARTPSLSPGAYEWRIDDGTDLPWRTVRVEAGEETDVLVGPEELGALFDLFVRLDVRALEDKHPHWLTYAFRESAREFLHRTSMSSHPDDPEGFLRVQLRGVREGPWFVQLQLDPGIEASLNPLRVVPGEPAPTMVLTPAQDRVPLRVLVIAKETGKVIPGAQAAYLRTMSDAAPLARDGDGGFVAKPVKSGVPMTLVASAPGYQDHAERFVPAAPENEVVIELVRGYRERVVVVNMTTSEFEANVGVFADGVEVGRTDGDGALWLTSARRPETLEVASDDPGANVVYSSFRDFQKYGESSPMGWIFGVTRR